MNIKHVREQISSYLPSDAILIEYWDREWFEARIGSITDTEWQSIINAGDKVLEYSGISDLLIEMAEDELASERGNR